MSPLIVCLAGTSHIIKRIRNVLPIQLVVHLELDSARPDPRFPMVAWTQPVKAMVVIIYTAVDLCF